MRRRLGRKERKKQKKILIIGSLSLLLFLCVGYAAFSTNLNITAKGNIKEITRVIQSWNDTSQTDFHSDYYKQNIVSVTFLDNNNVPSNATESWNVSEDKENGGVMAWVIPTLNDNTKYDLYIGAKGGVIANEISGYLFYGFSKIELINFNNNFDTKDAINMYGMFYGTTNLKELDLQSFNTSKVTTMNVMFGYSGITKIELKNFDTTNVVDMRGMFWNCQNLTSIDLNNFNTSNVTSMRAMFMGCTNLTEVNLCNFDTSKVTTVQDMFSDTNKLSAVYVGNKWNLNNAITANMFLNSSISSVTTGKC